MNAHNAYFLFPSFSVTNGSHSLCHNGNHLKVSQLSGYLASHVTETSRLGSMDCPWLLEASPGQTLKLSVIDFSWAFNRVSVCGRANGYEVGGISVKNKQALNWWYHLY